jgi:putative aldouronate transport system substrate-binding protein
MKKVFAMLLALVMILSLAACAPAGGDKETTAANNETTAAVGGDETTEAGPTSLFDKADGVKIEIWASPNTDLEMSGCYANLAINKVTNAEVSVFEFEEQSVYDSAMAEQKVPQITYHNGLHMVQKYGPQGAYINMLDYLDQMPNVKALLEDSQWELDVAKWTHSDGVMYAIPAVATGYSSVWGYLYRGDIFEANNLEFPTTQEEFYNTLVKLKELYPDSYPFVIRQMKGNMQGLEAWGYNWGGNHELGGAFNTLFDFDHSTNTYYFAQTSSQMKEMISFLNKLYDEGLLHPSCLTMDTAQWTEALATNKSFITYDKVDRIPALTAGATDADADWVLKGATPIAMGSKGAAVSKKQGPTNYGFAIASNLSDEDLANALAYVDWLCSPEGIEVTNWGIEGESYEVDAEGNKFWKSGFTYAGSGLGVAGLRLYQDFDAFKASYDENVQEALDIISPAATGAHDPVLVYNDDEQYIYDTYRQSIYDASLAELQKFILGQRDVDSDWDIFVAEMEMMSGYDDLMKIHNDAYARYAGK